jgi:hypothetical protein
MDTALEDSVGGQSRHSDKVAASFQLAEYAVNGKLETCRHERRVSNP